MTAQVFWIPVLVLAVVANWSTALSPATAAQLLTIPTGLFQVDRHVRCDQSVPSRAMGDGRNVAPDAIDPLEVPRSELDFRKRLSHPNALIRSRTAVALGKAGLTDVAVRLLHNRAGLETDPGVLVDLLRSAYHLRPQYPVLAELQRFVERHPSTRRQLALDLLSLVAPDSVLMLLALAGSDSEFAVRRNAVLALRALSARFPQLSSVHIDAECLGTARLPRDRIVYHAPSTRLGRKTESLYGLLGTVAFRFKRIGRYPAFCGFCYRTTWINGPPTGAILLNIDGVSTRDYEVGEPEGWTFRVPGSRMSMTFLVGTQMVKYAVVLHAAGYHTPAQVVSIR